MLGNASPNHGRGAGLNAPAFRAPIAPRVPASLEARSGSFVARGEQLGVHELPRRSSPNRSRSVMRDLTTMLRLRPVWVGLLAVLATACDYKVSAEATAPGQEIFELCVQCHGPAGAGQRPLNAPSIAGLPKWYVETQLKKFRSGARGTHWQDSTGMQMRPMALSFHNEADLQAVAEYVSKLPRPTVAPMLAGGNAENGKILYTPCTACHGADGAGVEQQKAPPLRAASDWYLATQLEHFKAGIRGANPRDIEGAMMRPMAMTLANEQAVKDVVAYISSLKR
jgi:cytochrome c oxidase subunit 2